MLNRSLIVVEAVLYLFVFFLVPDGLGLFGLVLLLPSLHSLAVPLNFRAAHSVLPFFLFFLVVRVDVSLVILGAGVCLDLLDSVLSLHLVLMRILLWLWITFI